MKKFTVTTGKLVKEGRFWNYNGMVDTDDHDFETVEEAREFFEGCDPREEFMTEGSVRGLYRLMNGEGYYAALVEQDDEGVSYLTIDEKTYSYDDYIEEEE